MFHDIVRVLKEDSAFKRGDDHKPKENEYNRRDQKHKSLIVRRQSLPWQVCTDDRRLCGEIYSRSDTAVLGMDGADVVFQA